MAQPTQHSSNTSPKRLRVIDQPPFAPPVGDIDIDAEVARFEAEERARLGLEQQEHWVERMAGLYFTKSQKSKVTMLIGGLTMMADKLIGGAFENLGYNVVPMDCPDTDALQVGKEFGNRGQCNPTYFTVGNLVKCLIQLRDQKGIPTQEIIDRFVFLTAGACGPCRFGMYVTEYRKALRDAGFDGFKVMLFQQQGGVQQATGEGSGLDLNGKFFLAMIKGGLAADVLNAIGYRLRPYELEAGATDRALEHAKETCYQALKNGKSILWALLKCRRVFAQVKVDRTRIKPRVAIIGEFWAMTTEGDGNYRLQRFLEQEGAEADIQLIAAWALFSIWEVANDTANRARLREADGGPTGLASAGEFGVFQREAGLWVAEKVLRVLFQTFAHAGGFPGYHLPDMYELARIAAPYYNNDVRGGEGHMEVGKLILNVVKNKANMTLSVKPFGCMPSSGVSDGVQSLITEKFPGTIYCPVETSGDGAVNFYSRVQMYLFKAKESAQAEVDQALAKTGLTMEQVRDYLARHPRLGHPLHKSPHAAASTAADLVYEVGDRINTTRLQRTRRLATRTLSTGKRGLVAFKARAPQFAQVATRVSREALELAREAAPRVAADLRGKVQAKVGSLRFGSAA